MVKKNPPKAPAKPKKKIKLIKPKEPVKPKKKIKLIKPKAPAKKEMVELPELKAITGLTKAQANKLSAVELFGMLPKELAKDIVLRPKETGVKVGKSLKLRPKLVKILNKIRVELDEYRYVILGFKIAEREKTKPNKKKEYTSALSSIKIPKELKELHSLLDGKGLVQDAFRRQTKGDFFKDDDSLLQPETATLHYIHFTAFGVSMQEEDNYTFLPKGNLRVLGSYKKNIIERIKYAHRSLKNANELAPEALKMVKQAIKKQ